MMDAAQLSTEEITSKVITILREILETDEAITADTSLVDELDIDSLTMVRMDISIQSEIGLALSADDLEEIEKISDLVTMLQERGQPVEDLD